MERLSSRQQLTLQGGLVTRCIKPTVRHSFTPLCTRKAFSSELFVTRRHQRPSIARGRAFSRTRAVQQTDSPQATATEQHIQTNSEFGISSSQLQHLAENRGVEVFENSAVNSVYQLAQSLRVSLEFGLVTDASELEARRAAFGSNTLPEKEEVHLDCYSCRQCSGAMHASTHAII